MSGENTTISTFKIRNTAPTRDGPESTYYFDDNPYEKTGIYGMPNCTAYAWGRFYELLGSYPNLSTGDAEDFYTTSDGYQRGQTPRVGAIICWSHPDEHRGGHVAVVENINSDGSIDVSESGWNAYFFRYREGLSGSNWGQPDTYIFQGFIYNPGVSDDTVAVTGSAIKDKLTYFIDAAKSRVSKQSSSDGAGILDWITYISAISEEASQNPLPSFTSGFLDSLADPSLKFVLMCAGSIKELIGKVFPEAKCRNSLIEYALEHNMGAWLGGPANAFSRTPHPGDVIYIRTSAYGERSKPYDCDRVGIVTTIMSGNKFEYTYEDRQGVNTVQLAFDSTQIAGYYRPNWHLVGANILNQVGISLTLSVYNELSGRDDAAIREIGYLNSSLEPSIHSSNMRFSVINYTSGISALFLTWGGSAANVALNSTFGDLVLDGFTSVESAIVEQLMSYGLNSAIAIGILANISHETVPKFNLASVGDGGTSFGLCQWHNDYSQTPPLTRGDDMKAHCGGGDLWKNSLTGQIDYLWKELNSSQNYAYRQFANMPDTLQGCRDTAYNFCVYFEVPSDKYVKAEQRADTAEAYWNKAVTQLSDVGADK